MRLLLATPFFAVTAGSLQDEVASLLQSELVSLLQRSGGLVRQNDDCLSGPGKCLHVTTQPPQPPPKPTTNPSPNEVTTPRPTTLPPTPPFEPPAKSQCKVWGDPQVNTFDGLVSALHPTQDNIEQECPGLSMGDVDGYKDGDFYLVKSPEIRIQGRFASGIRQGRSVMREMALTVGDDSLVVKPSSFWYGKIELKEDEAGGFTLTKDEAGGFTLTWDDDGWVITHDKVASLKVWLRQTIVSAALDVLIFKDGKVEDLSGLCGNADGNRNNDCSAMTNLVSEVPKGDSKFLEAPFDFAGCSTRNFQQDDPVEFQFGVPNAEVCAQLCKGSSKEYPEFSTKGSGAQMSCVCSDVKQMADLPQTLGQYNKEKCMTLNQQGSSSAWCVFKKHVPAVKMDCSEARLKALESECEQTGWTTDLRACAVDACFTQGDTGTIKAIMQENLDFINEIPKETEKLSVRNFGQRIQ